MMIALNQVFFEDSNLSLFFLSPYVDITKVDNEIFLRRFESDLMVCIPAQDTLGNDTSDFLQSLKEGVSETEIRNGLYNLVGDDAEDFLETCMQSGIIE